MKLSLRAGVGITAVIASISIYYLNARSKEILIDPLRDFAVSFEPCPDMNARGGRIDSVGFCTNLQYPPQDVLFVLDHREIDYEYTKWVLLVYLKLLEKQLILHNQCFEVRDTPFFFKRFTDKSAFNRAFCKIVGDGPLEKWLGPEFLCSWDAYTYITEHSDFIGDKTIEDQVRTIDSLQRRRGR